MTVLSAVNSVLRRLRKDEVSTLDSTDYSKLILDLLNESRREVESAWNWSALRTKITVTTSAGDNTYDLAATNPDTKILWAIDDTNDQHLCPLETSWYIDYQDNLTTSNNKPTHWDLYGNTSAGLLQVRLYPTPAGTYTVYFYCVVPQDDFTTSDGATVIKVPNEPVILGTYLRAISERGEDVGNLSEIILQRYERSLGNAISVDASHYGEELTWRVR